MTVLLEFLTALLEYLDLFNGIVQSVDFPTASLITSLKHTEVMETPRSFFVASSGDAS